jgi:hypothetical protein
VIAKAKARRSTDFQIEQPPEIESAFRNLEGHGIPFHGSHQ